MHVGEAFCKHGVSTMCIDMAHAPCNDLSIPVRAKSVLQLLPHVKYIGIELPCQTWSKARRAPQWSSFPHQLRSHEHIFGLPVLTDKDAAKARTGNIQAAFALMYIRRSLSLGVAGYIENPMNSWLWSLPGFVRILKHPAVRVVDTCMCAFGARWRKPTRLVFWLCSPSPHFRMCTNKGKLCDFNHRAHIVLSGTEKGVFRTSHAQVYPARFAKALCDSLLSPPPDP